MHIRFNKILWLAALGVISLSMATRMDALQARYQQDIASYEAYNAMHDEDEGDKMPTKARHEKAVHASAAAGEAVSTVPEAPVAVEAPVTTKATGETIVETAFKYLGVRYRSGSSSPAGFDCSGFTRYVFKENNLSLTHSSRAQYTEGSAITSKRDLRKGDLVFFGGSGGSTKSIGHVGIVTEVDPQSGDFKFIHASRTGIKVDNSTEPYYSRRYVGACRVLQ